MTTEYERIEIKQNRGPTLEFNGKEIASTEFETRGRDPMQITLEVYETPAGALVAISSSVPADRPDGFEDVRAHVVRPTDDVGAMQREVMEFFGWADRARSMLRKAGWSFKMEID
ncbi:hypothetical protein [Novosphingobium sp. KN65.2]|uniref:hypothetical protein n=1 Tax=Novosphingobium sp. KN65.2 TaxID=1478134 RepID=UPI0005E1E327|nr:hypothetical protein [Novosphingobium sp. KN65.2]CDO34026.1 hypothetical protein SPHV1_100060 [Novosphingobium sp. KN65.2]